MSGNIIKAKTNISGPGFELIKLIEKKILDIDFSNLKILDIGFNDPSSFILLHHLYGLKNYIGIDTIEINQFHLNIDFDLSISIPEKILKSGNETPYDRYQLFYKYVLKQIIEKNQNILSRNEFEKIFQFEFETRVENFVVSKLLGEYKPNMLILSNILHLFYDKKESHLIYTKLLEKVSDDGIIWIKIYNSNEPESPGRFPYSSTEIDKLKEQIDCIYEEELGEKTLIVGRKK